MERALARLVAAVSPHEAIGGVLWFAVLLGLVTAGGLALYWIRRKTHQTTTDSLVPFSLDDLRHLRESGHVTEEEYESLRQSVIRMVRETPAPGAAGNARFHSSRMG